MTAALNDGLAGFRHTKVQCTARLMPDITRKVLAATLRNLEDEGLIGRTV
jgi:DNA-binding HxlR family transcriptional regulator